MIKLQIASADDVGRPDYGLSSCSEEEDENDKAWKTLIEFKKDDLAHAVLEELAGIANDEEFSLENNWLRVVECKGKQP